MKIMKYITALVLGLAFSAPASAAVIKFVSNENAQVFTEVALQDVDLVTASGVQGQINLTLPEAKTVLISFFAECSIAGGFQSWVDIDILIKRPGDADFVKVAPTGSDNAFCSGGSDAQDNWVSAAAAGVIRVPAGASLVKVQVGRGFTSGEGPNTIRLDDLLLVVQD